MADDKRQSKRKQVIIKAILRKATADGSTILMEFRTQDLSQGGVFVATEDLAVFDLGEEVELLVEVDGKKYYEGKGKVVRSARMLTDEGERIGSGYGIMFVESTDDFRSAVADRIENSN